MYSVMRGTRRATLGSGVVTLTGDQTIAGVKAFTDGMSSRLSSASVHALTLQNTDAGGKAFQILDDDDVPWVMARKSANGHQVFSINTRNEFIPDNSTVLFADTHSVINGTGGYVMFDCGMEIAVVGQDDGAARFIASQTTPGADSGFRGIESYGLRSVGATAANGVWGIQAGAHSSIRGTTPYSVVGIHVSADNVVWGLGASPIRGNTGLMITGASGWDDGIIYYDVDNATKLFGVDQNGQVTSGHLTARSTGNYDLGTNADFWRVGYVQNLLVFNGSAAGPTVASAFDSDTGWFWDVGGSAPNTLGAATNGTQRFLFDANGNIVPGTAALAQNATNGFQYMIGVNTGTPSGTPAGSYAGRYPFVYDPVNHKICVYDGGWKSTAALT